MSAEFRLDSYDGGPPRELSIVGGPRPYIWVGGSEGSDGGCYGTLDQVREYREDEWELA